METHRRLCCQISAPQHHLNIVHVQLATSRHVNGINNSTNFPLVTN